MARGARVRLEVTLKFYSIVEHILQLKVKQYSAIA